MDAPSLFSRTSSTVSGAATWHPDPDFRGTWGIVSTCLATLIICVWKAVHIDIPLRQTRWNSVDKLGWLVVGILAPDLLLYTACCQAYWAYRVHIHARTYLVCPPKSPWQSSYTSRLLKYARFRLKLGQIISIFSTAEQRYRNLGDKEAVTYHDEMIEKLQPSTLLKDGVEHVNWNESGTSAPRSRKHPWTLAHSFYAVMGGLVFETSTPIIGPHNRFTPTGSGVCFLMERAPELIPDISEASILNRSRSDGLGKALLIAQLLYFCISCAARWAQSLPLTLLEISTLAHAICAVATYLVWWKKPFNVAEPTVIFGPQADGVAAYLLLTSGVWRPVLAGVLKLRGISEYSCLKISRANLSDTCHSSEATVAVHETLQPQDAHPGQIIHIAGFTFVVSDKKPESYLSNFIYGRDAVPWCHRDRGLGNTARLKEQDLTRWRLAASAMARFPHHRPSCNVLYLTWRGGLQHSVFLGSKMRWWPCIPPVIAAVYGSCHLLGWNATLSTYTEHLMWRAGGLAMMVLGFCASVVPQVGGFHYQSKVLNASIAMFGTIIYFISVAAYPLIGSFLIGESVRQLFYLPGDAFRLPDFFVYLPHFA